MRRSNRNGFVAPLAAAALGLGLAACDQTQDTSSEAEALPLYTAPPTESTGPGEGERDNAASPAGEANTNRSDEAVTAGRQPDRPASTPLVAPSPAATPPPMNAKPSDTPDPHAGHNMPSMPDHDMSSLYDRADGS